MRVDIYQSMTNGEKFLSVESGVDIKKLSLPEDIASDFLSLKLFKTIETSTGDKRIAIDSKLVEDEIKKRGYAVHGAKVTFEESLGSK